MIYKYNITGMDCHTCVEAIKNQFLNIAGVEGAIVQLISPQAILTMQDEMPLNRLQSALKSIGDYTIIKADEDRRRSVDKLISKDWIKTYKPVLIIGLYIIGITLLIEINRSEFILENWMSNFMGGFFLVFSFFKFLDLKGFANAYFTYDIVAKRWYNWAYMYVLIELGLGIAYILKYHLVLVDIITLIVMLIGLWGVLQSILSKQKIKCACLGTIFNLPMGTLTIIENMLMIAMSGIMLLFKLLRS